MIVTIWRHGAAGSAVSDRLRQLTGSGEDDIGFGCHQFHEACQGRNMAAPQLILHSPWLRTTQTADIVATAFSHAARRSTSALQPGSDVPMVDDALAAVAASGQGAAHVVLISHQPLVSQLADHYLGDGGRVPALSPGGLVSLALEVPAAGCGRLLFWALPPEYEAGI